MATSHFVRRRAAAATLVFLVLLASGGGSVVADTATDLARAEARLSSLLESIRSREAAVRRLGAESSALAQEIATVRSRIGEARVEARRLSRELRSADRELAALQRRLDERARSMFERGKTGLLSMVLGSTSLSDFSLRLEYAARSDDQDADLAATVANRRAALEFRRLVVRRLQQRLQRDRTAFERHHRQLQRTLAEATAHLAAAEQDRRAAETLVAELKDRRAREMALERLRARLATGGLPSSGAAGDGGGGGAGPFTVCPVDAPRAYWDDFGMVKPDGRIHQGIDVFAPTGTPIRAPFAGTAADATNEIGGLAVKVFGANGYVYNAHLSRMGTLGAVAAGDVVGYVGDSGNAVGTAPHDHFEWHPDGGAAVNPFPHLNEAC